MDERRDDWHHGVDQNLAGLNAGQRVWERELVIIRKLLGEFDHLLRGDPDKDTDGVMARLHYQENEVNLLKAVLLKDKAGNRGLVGRVEALEKGEKGAENRWKFATALVVALLSLLGLILTNWGPILAYLGHHGKVDPLEQAIESAKRPKPRHRHYVIHEETPEDSE